MTWPFAFAHTLLSHARALLRWLVDRPLHGLCLALASGLAWLALVTLPARDAALADMTRARDAEAQAHAQTRTNYATAQLIAEQAALAARAAQETRYKELATHADDQFAAGRAAALAAADRHIAAHRLPVGTPPGTLVSTPGQSFAPGAGGGADSGDRSGGPAQLVAVMDEDVRICTVNTLRLLETRDWALRLAAASDTAP